MGKIKKDDDEKRKFLNQKQKGNSTLPSLRHEIGLGRRFVFDSFDIVLICFVTGSFSRLYDIRKCFMWNFDYFFVPQLS